MKKNPKRKSRPMKLPQEKTDPRKIDGSGIIELEIFGTITCINSSPESEFLHNCLKNNKAFGGVAFSNFEYSGRFIVMTRTMTNSADGMLTSEFEIKLIQNIRRKE